MSIVTLSVSVGMEQRAILLMDLAYVGQGGLGWGVRPPVLKKDGDKGVRTDATVRMVLSAPGLMGHVLAKPAGRDAIATSHVSKAGTVLDAHHSANVEMALCVTDSVDGACVLLVGRARFAILNVMRGCMESTVLRPANVKTTRGATKLRGVVTAPPAGTVSFVQNIV